MTEIALRLKNEIRLLSEDDRAELMAVLRESLEQHTDDGYHEAWEAELNRRSEEIESGKAIGRPAQEVFDELRKRFTSG